VNKSDEDDFRDYVATRMEGWRRTAYLLCRDWHAADDIVSIAVGKVYDHWRKVGRADNRDAYAQRILTRTWLDERRRPWRRERPHAALPEVTTVATQPIVDRDSLATFLASLHPRQRAVVVLRLYLGYSIGETAALLGIAEGTVKSQATRGLENLRAQAALQTD
jgi:RNA polymerase sigma-70 factor (sigma-E family)